MSVVLGGAKTSFTHKQTMVLRDVATGSDKKQKIQHKLHHQHNYTSSSSEPVDENNIRKTLTETTTVL